MHNRFDTIFKVSLLLKALDSLIEIISGTFLLFITPDEINHFAYTITHTELAEDPHDFISNLILKSAHGITNSKTMLFGAIYLLVHGIVKLILVVAVLKNQFWAYPMLIVVLVVFIVYQTIQITHHFSYGYSFLSVFDAFVAVLTAIEWRKQILLREYKNQSHANDDQ